MNVAEMMIAGLEEAGVTTAYGVPGEENTCFMLALEASGIDLVLTRHEQAAAFMASVHGRITGQPAVCFATLGPGATNLVTGVADATLDHVPMIVITGQGVRSRLGKTESHQIINLEKLFEPVTKLSRRLNTPDEVAGAVAEAVRLASTARPGAVHLSLPEDLAGKQVEGAPLPVRVSETAMVPPKAVVRALGVLQRSERPLIVAGAGVLRAGAGNDLRNLAESANIPLISTFMAKGLMPAEHALHLHCIGDPFDNRAETLIETRGLIVAVGFDPVELSPAVITGDGAVPVLHINDVPASLEHDWTIACDLPGDIGHSLRGLVSGLKGRQWPEDGHVTELRARITRERREAGGPARRDGRMHPAAMLRAVEQTLEADSLVISGVGMHKMNVARYLAAKQPGQIIVPNGLAGMGLALPGAIAAARLGRHGRVIAICGDGEFLMNLQEMETAHRLGLSLTVVMPEDGAYGLIEAKQEDDTGKHTELSFGNPDWGALARAFGWTHHRVEDEATLEQTLADHRVGLHLITLPIHYDHAEDASED